MEESKENPFGLQKRLSGNGEVTQENPFLKNQTKVVNPFTKTVSSIPMYNPFTQKPLVHSKSEYSFHESKDDGDELNIEVDSFLDDYLSKCQLTPSEVATTSLDSLFQHHMYNTIVKEFYPINSNLAASDLSAYFDYCYYICVSFIYQNRVNEAQALLETCFSYYENPKRRYSAVDELPDEILPSEDRQQFFPFKLLVLSNSIKIMTGNLEELLWKRLKKEEMKHEWWNSCSEIAEDEIIPFITQIEDILMNTLLSQENYSSLEYLLTSWINLHHSNQLPIHKLFYIQFQVYLLLGKEEKMKILQKKYNELLGEVSDLPMLNILMNAFLKEQQRAFSDAIPLFEQVSNFSIDHSFQTIAIANASLCYYYLQQLNNAMKSIENYIFKDPEHNVSKEMIKILLIIIDESYHSEEGKQRKKALQNLFQKYHHPSTLLCIFDE